MPDMEDAVSRRLRAVMTAFQIESYPEMAEICDASKSSVSNWVQGYNLPRVPEMIRLCERTGITLDWIYRGSPHTMDPKLTISLGAIVDRSANGK